MNDDITSLIPYVNEAKQPVRIGMVDGQPWLMLSDLCTILGIGNPTRAAKRLDSDEVTQTVVDTGSGPKTALVISEPGFYHLVLTSRSEAATPLRRWLTHEVLPAIHAHGAYLTREMTHLVAIDYLEMRRALTSTDSDLRRLKHIRYAWNDFDRRFIPLLNPDVVAELPRPDAQGLATEIRARTKPAVTA